MPKPKPDQVIRHELVLGSVERKLLDEATTAYQVNKIATPIVNLMNDVTGMIVLLSLLASVGALIGLGVSFIFLVDDDLSIAGVIDAFVTQTNQHRAAMGLTLLRVGTSGIPVVGQYYGFVTRFLQALFGLDLGEQQATTSATNYADAGVPSPDVSALLHSAVNAGYSTVVGNNMAWAQGWSNSGGQVPFP